jgi:hypothetical protein
MFLLDAKSQVIMGKEFWSTIHPLWAKIFFSYNKEYLYMAAVVDLGRMAINHMKRENIWNGDCVEVYLNTHILKRHINRFTWNDYHLGFSPGNHSKNPKMWCFNKDEGIFGGRISAVRIPNGYILEAAIPLTFFYGLHIYPGKILGLDIALDVAGPVSGMRVAKLDFSKNKLSESDPALWTKVALVGTPKVRIKKYHRFSPNAKLVKNGLHKATLMGKAPLSGIVLGPRGVPVANAKLTTWPRSTEVKTNAKGVFTFPKILVYKPMVVYARKDGFFTSLSRVHDFYPVTIHIQKISPKAYSVYPWVQKNVSDFKIFKINNHMMNLQNWPRTETEIDDFEMGLKALKPWKSIIQIPSNISNAQVRQLLTYCNFQKKFEIKYWIIKSANVNIASLHHLNAFFDYINQFRKIYNIMKGIDPTILISGPAINYASLPTSKRFIDEFLKYDGDIDNIFSVQCNSKVVLHAWTGQPLLNKISQWTQSMRDLRYIVDSDTDCFIPIAICQNNINFKLTKHIRYQDYETRFYSLLYILDQFKSVLNNKIYFCVLNNLFKNKIQNQVEKDLWEKLNNFFRYQLIDSEYKNPQIVTYADQNMKTHEVYLAVINNNARNIISVNISLDGHGSGIRVNARIQKDCFVQIPAESIAVFKFPLKRRAQELLYTPDMFNQKVVPGFKPLD